MKFSILKYVFITFLLTSLIYGCGNSGTNTPVPTPVPPTATPTETGLEVRKIQVKDKFLDVEVADEADERQTGLMYRTELGENKGMLFVFPVPGKYSFWMKNTYIPLSIAFITEEGIITQIEDMEPETETSHPSLYVVKYALEVNQGWFDRNNIKAGDIVYLD